MMLSDVCLSVWRLTSVAYIRSVGGVCGRPAGLRVLADRAGSAGLARGCRCALPLQAWVGAYRGSRPPTARIRLYSLQMLVAFAQKVINATASLW